MNDLIEEFEQDGLVVKIYSDESPESPREWDNLGHMICRHRRYNLGDEQFKRGDSFPSLQDAEEWLVKERAARIVLQLWTYEHGQITITARPGVADNYPDRQWDVSTVGFIYITADDIRQEFGVKRISRKLEARVAELLKGEVDVYDQYLQGDVWGYVIEEPPEEEDGEPGKELDSCWGYYGLDYAREEAKAAASAAANKGGST